MHGAVQLLEGFAQGVGDVPEEQLKQGIFAPSGDTTGRGALSCPRARSLHLLDCVVNLVLRNELVHRVQQQRGALAVATVAEGEVDDAALIDASLDLEEPLDNEPKIDGYNLRLDDPLTLVTSVNKDKSINKLFNELNKIGIKVKSMRNESNRLEELFIETIKNKHE